MDRSKLKLLRDDADSVGAPSEGRGRDGQSDERGRSEGEKRCKWRGADATEYRDRVRRCAVGGPLAEGESSDCERRQKWREQTSEVVKHAGSKKNNKPLRGSYGGESRGEHRLGHATARRTENMRGGDGSEQPALRHCTEHGRT